MASEVRNGGSPIVSAVRRKCLSSPLCSRKRWRTGLRPCRQGKGDGPMVSALLKALTLLRDRAFWRVLWHSVLISIASFAALYGIVWGVLTHVAITDIRWLDTLANVLGGLAVLALTWLLFPAVATLVISFFLDRIVEAVERRYYPHLPPLVPLSLRQSLSGSLKFTAVLVGVNLLALPLYLVPGLNVVVFYGVNAYLLGR